MKKIIGGLLFLSELILWIGAGRLAALLVPFKPPIDAIIGLAVTVLFVIVWAMFFAPRANHRLEKLQRVMLAVFVAILIGFWLFRQGDIALGWAVLLGSSIMQILGQYAFKDYIYPDKLI